MLWYPHNNFLHFIVTSSFLRLNSDTSCSLEVSPGHYIFSISAHNAIGDGPLSYTLPALAYGKSLTKKYQSKK